MCIYNYCSVNTSRIAFFPNPRSLRTLSLHILALSWLPSFVIQLISYTAQPFEVKWVCRSRNIFKFAMWVALDPVQWNTLENPGLTHPLVVKCTLPAWYKSQGVHAPFLHLLYNFKSFWYNQIVCAELNNKGVYIHCSWYNHEVHCYASCRVATNLF